MIQDFKFDESNKQTTISFTRNGEMNYKYLSNQSDIIESFFYTIHYKIMSYIYTCTIYFEVFITNSIIKGRC